MLLNFQAPGFPSQVVLQAGSAHGVETLGYGF